MPPDFASAQADSPVFDGPLSVNGVKNESPSANILIRPTVPHLVLRQPVGRSLPLFLCPNEKRVDGDELDVEITFAVVAAAIEVLKFRSV